VKKEVMGVGDKPKTSIKGAKKMENKIRKKNAKIEAKLSNKNFLKM